jgi:hypothetical protein
MAASKNDTKAEKSAEELLLDAVRDTYPGVIENATQYTPVYKEHGDCYVDVRIPVEVVRDSKKEGAK